MKNRKMVSKRLRFDILKRDTFKCLYCGRGAPEVELLIDHLDPVSKDGSDERFNLITSCFDCNAGKANIAISDEIRKQCQQLNISRDHAAHPKGIARGGARVGAGRKATDGATGLAHRRTVLLNDLTITRLLEIGDGNVSAGIRIAADRASLLPPDFPDER